MNGLLEMNISQLFLFGIIFSLFLFLSPIIFYSLVIFSIKKSKINKNLINLVANENIEKNNRALIVIPILNGASRIKERITNIVANCSPSDFEIVIISDGSRDNTYEEALKHSKLLREKGWKLDVIQNELNIGRAASHNKAVEKSKNEIIIFTDLDTRFSKTFPQNSLKYLRKNSHVGAVSAEVKFEI